MSSQVCILQGGPVRSKMAIMSELWDKFEALCKDQGTSPYKVALSVGMDGSLPHKVMTGKRNATIDYKLDMLKQLAASALLDVDYNLLVTWLMQEVLSSEALLELAKEVKSKRKGGKE